MPAHAETAADAPSASGRSAVPEITVTARRRDENLQDVPIAISVVTGDTIDRAYIVNTQNLATMVPALNYSSANPRNTAFTIRGLGSSVVAVSQANDGLEGGVGFYVDQVYHARPATAAFDFSDIAQVEVLRGPQGTLFGKNTTAGAINVTSRLPTFTPEAREEISYGDYNWLQAKASASGPISDTLAYRISGLVTRRDGVIDNVATGSDVNSVNNQAVRAQLLYKPSDDFQSRIIADFSNFQGECCTQVFLRVAPTPLRRAEIRYANLLTALPSAVPASTNPYDRTTNIDANVGTNTNEGGVSAIIDWNLGFATLTSVSAWRFWNWDAANDRDYTGARVQLTQHIPSRQDQYSQELRLATNGDGPLHAVGGLYYFHQKLNGRPISIYGPDGARWLLGTTYTSNGNTVAVPANLLDGYGTDGRTHFVTDSYAAFGEASYELLQRLTATLGLRYTYEEKSGTYDSPTFGGPALTGTPTQIATLTAARLSILRRQTYAASDKDGSLSGRANLAYRFNDGILGYASYARGFKSGGINMSGLPLNSANQPVLATAVVQPERNQTYEVGFKTDWLDRRVTFNITGYYTQVENFQATLVDTSQTVALRGYLSNIPEVIVKGVEIDAAVRPFAGLSISGALAYAEGEYSDYPKGPCPVEQLSSGTSQCNLTGRPLASLPRWTESVVVDYSLPVTDAGSIVFHADSNWRTRYNGDPSLSAYTWIEGYNLTNASIGYRSAEGWELSAFARNLFAADYIQNITVQAGNSGLILGTPSEPRIVGLTFRARQ